MQTEIMYMILILILLFILYVLVNKNIDYTQFEWDLSDNYFVAGDQDGVKDVLKARHYLERLLEHLDRNS